MAFKKQEVFGRSSLIPQPRQFAVAGSSVHLPPVARHNVTQCLIKVEQKPVVSREETLFCLLLRRNAFGGVLLFLLYNEAAASSSDKNAAPMASIHVWTEQQAHSLATDARRGIRLCHSSQLAARSLVWTVLV